MTRIADEALSRGGMAPAVEHLPAADVLSPADRYQELFVAVQTGRVFADNLNSFLYTSETSIGKLCAAAGDMSGAIEFRLRAAARGRAIDRYLWSEADGAFFDYDWRLLRSRPQLNAATTTPLYVGLAIAAQAHGVARALEARLLAPGGVMTTEQTNGQQWDRPNGWAPLQWMALSGLRRYGENALAQDVAQRWLATVAGLYERESKLVEKYVLSAQPSEAAGGAGGEYPLQDGFGWTNGIVRRLLDQHPAHHAHQSRAGKTRRWL